MIFEIVDLLPLWWFSEVTEARVYGVAGVALFIGMLSSGRKQQGFRLREKASPTACPYCRDVLKQRSTTCESCRVSMHPACSKELGGCATLGCARKARARLSKPV